MSEWISVKDKLPEEEKYVLVYYENRITKPIDVGWHSLTLKMWNVGYLKTGIVSHWMPLPEIPKDNTCRKYLRIIHAGNT